MLLYYTMTYYERNLPHWLPDGKAVFVTWRLSGSLPEHILSTLRKSAEQPGRQFARAEHFLDRSGFGEPWLRHPAVASAVERTILRGSHELDQYSLIAYVVMPNHVHMLIEPRLSLERIMRGIKGVSGRDANRILRRPGLAFWQAESFDHWVRTSAEGEKICRYIESNPVKAGLAASPTAWPWSSASKSRT